MHTLTLIVNASVRNRWINDELLHVRKAPLYISLGLAHALQARLLSLTPLPIQNSFAMIHKSRIPDDVKRGYLFEQAVARLASWWAGTFFNIKPKGHLRSRTFEDVQHHLCSKGLVSIKGKGKEKALPQDVDPLEDLFEDEELEIVRSEKSLMKHALMQSGSRDVSSQLFTALCRALGIPTRLVVSLQSVPWQTNVGRSKTPTKQKGSDSKGKSVEPRVTEDDSGDMKDVDNSQQNESSSEDDMQVDENAAEQISSPGPNGKGKTSYSVKMRKSNSPRKKLRPSAPLFSELVHGSCGV